MLQKIREYFFKKHAKSYLETLERQRSFVTYKKARTVLVLFESDEMEKNPNIQDIIQTLQKDGKKVTAWGYVNKKECTSTIKLDFRIIHQKQTDLLSKPLITILNELQDLEFDLLIDLSIKPVLAIQYLVLYSKALCKTGLKKNDLPIYDFMIDAESTPSTDENPEYTLDETYLFNQIIFYLKSIQTKD